jgi:hypothetical protein
MNPNQPRPNNPYSEDQQFDPTFIPPEMVDPADSSQLASLDSNIPNPNIYSQQPNPNQTPNQAFERPEAMPQYSAESIASSRPVQSYQQNSLGQLPAVDPVYQANNLPQNSYGSGQFNRPSGPPNNIGPSSKKSGLKIDKATSFKIIGFICGLLLVGLIFWLLWANFSSSNSNSTSAPDSDNFPEPQSQPATASSISANSLNDLAAVCKSTQVSNAPAYKPGSQSPVGLFIESSDDNYIVSDIVLENQTLVATDQNYAQVQTVGCLTRQSTSDTGINCTFEDSDTKKTRDLDLYTVTYDLSIYETKTNNKISSSQVQGSSTKCPLEATISKSDPKLYVAPDASQVNQIIDERAD